MNILLLVGTLNITNGVTSHLFYFIKFVKENYPNIKFYIICRGGNSFEAFESLNVKIVKSKIFDFDKRNVFYYLLAKVFILFFTIFYKINVLHAHTYYMANIASTLKYFNIKCVQTQHGLITEPRFNRIFKLPNQIAVNPHVEEYLSNLEQKFESISLIPYGLPQLQFLKMLLNKSDKIKVIAASRFVKEKGIFSYLDAIKALPEKTIDKAEFFVAGFGPEEEKIKSKIFTEKIPVNYLGQIDTREKYFRDYDIFVYSGSSQTEGFPLSIIEAGLSRCIVIAASVRGINMVLEDHVDSLLYSINDTQTLSELIEYALSNYYNLDLGLRLFEKFRELHSLEKNSKKILDIYGLNLLNISSH